MRSMIVFILIFFVVSIGCAATLQDPTMPMSFQPKNGTIVTGVSDLNISFTLVGKDRRVAVINGQSFIEGDQLDGLKIMAIYHGLVEFQDEKGETFTVEVQPQKLTKTAQQTELKDELPSEEPTAEPKREAERQ